MISKEALQVKIIRDATTIMSLGILEMITLKKIRMKGEKTSIDNLINEKKEELKN
jgi:hypothetical protein